MFPENRRRLQSQRSSALIIVLAGLVLVSGIIIVFFEQSDLNRQISFSSAGQYRADLMARTALDTITSDLRNEIVAGSTVYTTNGVSIYIPTNNFTCVPYRSAPAMLPNLITQSASTSNVWTGPANYYSATIVSPIRSAANNSTSAASLNGRSISINRWNKPGLLDDPGSGVVPNLPAAYTTPPDWVLITRRGAVTNAPGLPTVGPSTAGSNTLSDKSLSNENYVVGRYAYTIYDEGGLLDINVAGFPGSISPTDDFATKRGLLSQIDLGNIPGVFDSNALVSWRNPTSVVSAAAYTNYVFNATNGFTSVATGDQIFLSRQDLIDYIDANSSQITTAALPYLGTFTRELNAPSYTPPPLGTPLRPATKEGTSVGRDDQFNPSLINVRATSSFTRFSDNTQTVVGEPLIKYRFPLKQLNWIGYNGPNGATTTQIQNFFGLTYSNGVWTYSHGNTPGTIMNLAQVAAAKREPDFFELLQAAIVLGSLGKSAADPYASTSNDGKTPLQVMQIGADLIDQNDADSYPTRISFNGTEVDGVENLPYLARVFATAYRQPNSDSVGMWYQPEIWNPHAPGATPSTGPTKFRFVATIGQGGSDYFSLNDDTASPHTAIANSPIVTSFTSPGITFSTNGTNPFSSPTILSTAVGAVATSALDNMSSAGFIGIFLGSADAPDTLCQSTSTSPPPARFDWVRDHKSNVNFILQYQDQNGNWVSYSQMSNLSSSANPPAIRDNYWNAFQSYLPQMYNLHTDPRTDRFGGVVGFTQFSEPYTNITNPTIRPTTANGDYQLIFNAWPGWYNAGTTMASAAGATGMYLGFLSENRSTDATYYASPDGLQREADGAYADGTLSDGGYPLATDSFNNPSSRPIVLNRPFRSVADMGYAFRGEPWKSLDFFTAQSGDAALLDLFCIDTPLYAVASPSSPSPASAPEAGRIDLNTRQQPVLQAILAGAIKAESSPPGITINEAGTLADSLVALTKTMPLQNRSELVTRWAQSLSYSSAADTNIKARREGAIRALADVGNTRTWNLLIDVIAQSGRYTPSSTNLNQFMVEGETRYWLHVAIDRYTGKVLARYLEPVSE